MIDIDYLRNEAKERGSVPNYNGLGMVRLAVKDRGYLFYSDRAPPINHTIHDHRYSFTSTIIKGTIRNFIYSFEAVEQETDFMLTYKDMVNKVDTVGTIIHPNVNITNTCTFDTTENQKYIMHESILHHVERKSEKLITCMEPSPRPYSPIAHFLINKNIEYVGVYSQPKTPNECWEIIEYTIND